MWILDKYSSTLTYRFYKFLKTITIKKKIKKVAKNVRERLHREPYYAHPRLSFIPNIVLNIITFIIALALIGAILYLLINFLIKAFYHL
ncbi:hypothetical protein J2W95_002698 [Flavobacterium granuli]|uniref:Uncharacterized protein n=1 Tax=Flavobacterium granuli TaxID=280093 RepID=A0ABU1S4N0_9FLAO|nr:hypothetical protein [Flavobacterium granuli]